MVNISIIVPIYNLESFISQCVDSLLCQTLADIEILLIDDGSTDSCPEICDSYERADARVKVIHQKNMGLSGARNSGINASSGKWFMIVDGDDWLEPNAAEVLYLNAEKYDSDIFLASFYANYKDRQVKDSFFNVTEFHFNNSNKLSLQFNCISRDKLGNPAAASNSGVTWARLYKKAFIVDNNLTFILGLKRTQDAIFHLYAYEVAERVDFLDIPVCHYRIWDSSDSKKYSPDFDKTAKEIAHHIKAFMVAFNKFEEFSPAYYSKSLKLYLEIIKLKFAPSKNTMSFREKCSRLRALATEEPFKEAIKNASDTTLNRNQALGHFLLKHRLYGVLLRLYIRKVH